MTWSWKVFARDFGVQLALYAPLLALVITGQVTEDRDVTFLVGALSFLPMFVVGIWVLRRMRDSAE